MQPNPLCLLRGFINSIQAVTVYDSLNWIAPILKSDGSFVVSFKHVDGFGHDDLDLIAEAITRFENELQIPNRTISIKFYSTNGTRLSTVAEISSPYVEQLPRFAKHLFDVRDTWRGSPGDDEHIVSCMFQWQIRDDNEVSPEYIYEIERMGDAT